MKMKFSLLIVAFCLFAAASAATLFNTDIILNEFMDKPVKELFKVYHVVYKKEKEYNLNTEEGLKRYKIFKQTLKRVKSENARLGKQVYGLTKFADMTPEEFREHYLMKDLQIPTSTSTKSSDVQGLFDSEDVNIDHRNQLGEARDQAKCGSCWAFAATATIEANYSIQFGEKKILSEQFLVDCSTGDSGCSGGYPDRTFPWIMRHGMRLRDQVPYRAEASFCNKKTRDSAINIVRDFESCTDCKLEQWLEILKKGPMVVAMDASAQELKDYKPASNEPWVPRVGDCMQENHAITAVGASVEDGQVILLIRNSWGTEWGIQGHFRIPANNSCFISRKAWRPVVQQNTPFIDDESCPEFYTSCNYEGTKIKTCVGVSDVKAQFGGEIQSFKPMIQDHEYNWNGFVGPNCTGRAYTLGKGNECTKTNIWKKSFGSLATTRYGMRNKCGNFFSETCYSGNDCQLCGSIENVAQQGFQDCLNVGSLWVNDRFTEGIVFFEETNFGGYGTFVAADNIANLKSNTVLQDIFKKTKSIKIIQKRPRGV